MTKKSPALKLTIKAQLEKLKLIGGEVPYDGYGELFKGALEDERGTFVAKEEGNYDLLALAFEDIGDKLAGLGIHSSDDNVNKRCKYFTDALLNYQYSMQIMGNFECGWEYHSIASIKAKAKNLYLEFHKFIGNGSAIDSEELLDRISYKSEIQELRAKARLEISNIKEIPVGDEYKVTYAEKANGLFEEITAGMKHYLASIISDAEKFCGTKPCQYSVIGLGSMAMKQITPYSDLEFAILVEEDNEIVQEYFAKLGHYVNFAITALGETTLPTSQYDINLDHLVKKAVNLDLGGKTSLGREDKDYKLVCTVDEMLKNMTGEHNDSLADKTKVDSKLPFVLTTVCYVSGDLDLSREYQSKTQEYLNSFDGVEGSSLTKGQQRAIEVLSEKSVGRRANLEEFRPQSRDKEGQLFDVKQEIYRIPDRILYNLGLIYAVEQGEEGIAASDVIGRLEEQKEIMSEAALNLKFAAAYANILRLRTYDYYGEQKESADPLPGIEGVKYPSFRMNKSDTEFGSEKVNAGDLIQFSYTARPLVESLEKLCAKAKIEHGLPKGIFSEIIFYDASTDNILNICIRLGNYDYIIEHLEVAIPQLPIDPMQFTELGKCYNVKGLAYYKKGQYDKALEYCEKVLAIKLKTLGEDHPDTATCYNNIGSVHDSQGNYKEALEMHKKSLAIKLKTLGENHPDTATCYNNIGSVHDSQGNYKEALEYCEKALAIFLLGENDKGTATCYNNIGSVHDSQGNYKEALEMHKKSLAIRLKTFGEDHPDTAACYNNIGQVHQKQGNYKEALEMHKKSLAIRLKTLGENHPDTATSYSNIGVVHEAQGNYKEALEYLKKALAIKLKTLGENHPDTAKSYSNIGGVHKAQGNYKEALEYCEKALAIRLKTLGENHPEIATCYNNIGGVHQEQGQYDKALEYCEKALAIFLLGENDKGTATCYNNIGSVHKEQGNYKEALEMHKKSLAIRLKTFGEYHPDTATSYNNIGSVHQAQGNYKEALEYYEKALAIKLKTCGEDHPDTATCYNNIGGVHKAQGNYKEALEYCEKALAIFLLGENDKGTATCYNNIGSVHKEQGNYKEALEMHKKSLAIRLKTFGEYHPDTAACYNNIGQVHQKQGNYKEALEMHKKSLAIRLKTLGENHPDTAKSYSNIGVVHEAQGNYKEALEYLKKALAIKLKTCGEDHPDTATCYGNIGLVQQVAEVHAYAMSRFKTGEQKLEAGLAVIGAKPQKLRSLKLSVFKEAKTNLEAALEIFTSLKNSKEVKKTLQLLVKLYTKTGDIGLEKRKAELKSIYIKEQEAKNTSEALERSINEPELFLQKKTAAPVSESDITCLSRDITNLEDVPMKNPEHIIRIISYNVVADFFDENDKTPDHRHHWENRKPIIYKLLCILATDIMCFQELSPRQAFELAEYFAGEFNARFLSQTPSEIPTGAIIDGAGMKEWVGKFAGTPLVGTFARKIYKISEQGRFWLNDKPDEVPVKADRGETDKGFGNMNTYRAVLWLKLSSGHEDKELFVFNSHYPLNGDNKTRKSCAELERIKIKEITAGGNWISSGDRNIVPSDSDNDVDNPLSAYMVLAAGASDIRGHGPHYGISTTWLGFSYDKFKTELDKKSKSDHNVLDVMISNMKTINSFFHPGGYDLSRGEENPIIPLSEYAQAAVVEFLNSERCFASDHALIGADFILVHGGE